MESNNSFKFIPSNSKNQTHFAFTDPKKLFEALQKGNRFALSKAITLVESQRPADRQKADRLLQLCLNHKKESFVVGISGPPGVGKSTFIDSFGSNLIEKGIKLAVLTIDPSSLRTGGSILGDKTRMERLSRTTNAFVRPSPARTALGGVAQSTQEAIWICEAAGYDYILVETVGIGQSETVVRNMVDCFLLMLPPIGGDDLQGVKRGIMEMADIIIICKADGSLEKSAKKMAGILKPVLPLLAPVHENWQIPLLLVSSLSGVGFESLHNALHRFQSYLNTDNRKNTFRNQQLIYWFNKTLETRLIRQFLKNERMQGEVLKIHKKLQERMLSPFEAVDFILKLYQVNQS